MGGYVFWNPWRVPVFFFWIQKKCKFVWWCWGIFPYHVRILWRVRMIGTPLVESLWTEKWTSSRKFMDYRTIILDTFYSFVESFRFWSLIATGSAYLAAGGCSSNASCWRNPRSPVKSKVAWTQGLNDSKTWTVEGLIFRCTGCENSRC